MLTKRTGLSIALLALSSCANVQTAAISEAAQCPTDVDAIFDSIVGEWTLSVQADEGWTGYGSSRISWDVDQKCGLSERTVAVFNQESEDPFESKSTAYIVYDDLSETIKILTADNRGYVHIGIAAVAQPFRFEVLKPSGEAPNRQIQYRNIQPESFEWSWQGRADRSDEWEDRLIINYEKSH
ncbi:MAG: hypothetical protein AAFR82_00835 [Pseudomonadota bacterium]